MFKKIEIWILYFILLLGIPFTISFGVLVRQELEGKTKLGMLSKTALFLAEIPVNIKKGLFNSNLQIKEKRFGVLDSFNGTPNSNQSYLLLSRYDGDLGEGIVELIDLTNFKVLHTWNPDINEFNKLVKKVDEFKYLTRDDNDSRTTLFHPILVNDGGLLFNSSTLKKIDACSNLIFQNNEDRFHHSIEKDIDGNLWVPSHMYPQTLDSKKVGRKNLYDNGYHDDAIVKLSADGEILFKKSVSEIFIENDLEYLLFSVGNNKFNNDPIHLNDIQPVDVDGKFWKKGDVFLSLRHQSMVLLYRPFTNQIIWKGTGKYFHQHDVNILNDHKISVFNNNSKNFEGGNFVDGHNEISIYNFKLDQYSSYLDDSLVKNDVRTITQGRSKILLNGDLFIEETDAGRILYFDQKGNLRWTYINRADNGKNYLLSWSRILYSKEDIKTIESFLKLRGKCDE